MSIPPWYDETKSLAKLNGHHEGFAEKYKPFPIA